MKAEARFIISKERAIDNYDSLKEHADIISYSYKTNIDVGKILEEHTDSLLSIHSLESLKQLNFPKRSIFFAQGWDRDEIDKIASMGVRMFVVDNLVDLDRLLGYIDEKGIKITLFLRMRLKEHTIHTGKHYVFGMYSSKVNELIGSLKDNKNIERLGLHFHRKTQNVSEWSLKDELEDSISTENWEHISYVNIGGGLPAEYKNFSSSVMDNIFKKIKELRAWLNSRGIKMIIEPGRYIAASAVRLEANIVNIYENNIIIDCSVYNAAMDTFVAHIRLLIEDESPENEGSPYTIKGCTPDSMDIFRYRVFFKERPKVGDKIVFLNAGAYTYSTDFCNLKKLGVVIE